MKCAKVIACYFGTRRQANSNHPNMFDFINHVIDNEINIDNGYNTDVILTINKCDNELLDNYLFKFDKTKTKNGLIKVISRDNIGASFGAYLEAFLKFKNEYNYWFFCEDDVLIYKNEYIKYFIEYYNNNKNKISFISLAPISKNPKLHSGGGCGLTSTEQMSEIYTENNIDIIFNDYKKSTNNYNYFQECEVDFTNRFVYKNKTIQNHPDFNPFCKNFKEHSSQLQYNNLKYKKEYIYNVGKIN